MRKMKNCLSILSAGILFFSIISLSGCGAASKFETGKTVAAKWSDGSYYLAVIKKAGGDSYDVDYADGTKGTVKSSDIREIPEKPSLAAGDNVLAVWTTAKFYPGTVQEVKPEGAVIKWNDGSEPSLVTYGKILK